MEQSVEPPPAPDATGPGADVPGVDVASVTAWLERTVPTLDPPFTWSRLGGGHSNLTYLLRDVTGTGAVLRRPPLGALQPGAHDMGREYTVLVALRPTVVPVPEPQAYCDDLSVSGAPFYVMGTVEGRAFTSSEELEEGLPTEEERERVSESFIDVLADLHGLDVDEIGLGSFAKREDHLGRQLRAWHRSWAASVDVGGEDDPRAHDLHDRLAAAKPEQGPARLVHGDYALHNVLIGEDARVRAVLDWELCTLGDPLIDLGYLLSKWSVRDAEDATGEGMVLPTGFLTRAQLADRYHHRTGVDIERLDYYVAFNLWRAACISQGVATRYRRGQKEVTGDEVERFEETTRRRLGLAAAVAERAGI